MKRPPHNPVVTRADVPAIPPEYTDVSSVFNPGAIKFKGTYYLLLRGMAETHEPGCGIFFDRPDRETVQRVSALLGAAQGEGR